MKLFRLDVFTPRGGRKKPIKRSWVVMAKDEASVLPTFDEEYGAHQREGDQTQVTPWDMSLAPLVA